MTSLFRASFKLIGRQFPTRAFVQQVRLTDAILLYALTTLLAIVESFFPSSLAEQGNPSLAFTGIILIQQGVALAIILLVSRWVINRYAGEKFSLKEVFVLEVLLTSASTVIFGIGGIGASFLGTGAVAVAGIIGLIFSIYMLLTTQAAISAIAAISKSQAAYVILAPLALVFIVWFAFLSGLGGFAVTM